jgi:beta-carotene 3-hydroxylase
MTSILLILIGFFTFLFMEFVAWFTHKYVMHGFLWILHKDHHSPEHTKLEKNDLFALIFAIPSFLFIYLGALNKFPLMESVGFGIAAYGLAYFLYHDILYHKRLPLFGEVKHWYFKSIIRAHYDHHRGKKNYGFLFMVPFRYIAEGYRSR